MHLHKTKESSSWKNFLLLSLQQKVSLPTRKKWLQYKSYWTKAEKFEMTREILASHWTWESHLCKTSQHRHNTDSWKRIPASQSAAFPVQFVVTGVLCGRQNKGAKCSARRLCFSSGSPAPNSWWVLQTIYSGSRVIRIRINQNHG